MPSVRACDFFFFLKGGELGKSLVPPADELPRLVPKDDERDDPKGNGGPQGLHLAKQNDLETGKKETKKQTK